MSIKLSGQWDVSVKSKSAQYDQQIVVTGTTNGQDGVYHYAGFGTKTLEGAFSVQVQYKQGGEWHNSLMRLGDVSRSATELEIEIESDDKVGYGDLDFNDLVLKATKAIEDNDWCVWGAGEAVFGMYIQPLSAAQAGH